MARARRGDRRVLLHRAPHRRGTPGSQTGGWDALRAWADHLRSFRPEHRRSPRCVGACLHVEGREELRWRRPDGAPAEPHRLRLASTSPQRRAILEQLRIPFDVIAPTYVEHDPPGADPAALVRTHAEGKARSVYTRRRRSPSASTRPSTSTAPSTQAIRHRQRRADAARRLGRTHTVLSGVCLLGPGSPASSTPMTDVTFRDLTRP